MTSHDFVLSYDSQRQAIEVRGPYTVDYVKDNLSTQQPFLMIIARLRDYQYHDGDGEAAGQDEPWLNEARKGSITIPNNKMTRAYVAMLRACLPLV